MGILDIIVIGLGVVIAAFVIIGLIKEMFRKY